MSWLAHLIGQEPQHALRAAAAAWIRVVDDFSPQTDLGVDPEETAAILIAPALILAALAAVGEDRSISVNVGVNASPAIDGGCPVEPEQLLLLLGIPLHRQRDRAPRAHLTSAHHIIRQGAGTLAPPEEERRHGSSRAVAAGRAPGRRPQPSSAFR